MLELISKIFADLKFVNAQNYLHFVISCISICINVNNCYFPSHILYFEHVNIKCLNTVNMFLKFETLDSIVLN